MAAGGQGATQGDMASMIRELRGLRVAVERMSTVAPRVQLMLARLQLQEQRVNTLLRRVDAARATLQQTQREQSRLQQQMTTMETRMRTESDPKEQRALEVEILPQLKALLAAANEELQRAITDEAAAAQELNVEQSRWVDINQRLEELERSLLR
jgi:hypothetical protein